jgi:NitT/TauT family transport system substrate-binding protein
MQATRRTLIQAAIGGLLLPRLAQAETREIRIGIQYSLTYLAFAVAQHERTIEARARQLGLGDITITYNRSAGGTTMNDALLAGTLDAAATGFPSFFVLWAKARGRLAIKGLMSYGNTPLFLLTRNPAVKTVGDFTDADRIGVPAVKSSIQAMMLQMAAEKQFGQFDRLDHLTLSRSHPDAMIEMVSGGQLDSDFSAPPYQYEALGHPGIHTVTTSEAIFGGPSSNGLLYMTEAFHDQNPTMVKAINLGLRDAMALIDADPPHAAEMYLTVTGEKLPIETVLRVITAPGTRFEATPHGAMQFAQFMHRTGTIAKAPANWQEVFFSEAYDLPGD